MNVLLMGDVHGKFEWAHRAYQQLLLTYKQIDLLIQVGDFGFYPRIHPNRGWVSDFDHPCMFVDGNHEDHETLRSLDDPYWGMDDLTTDSWIQTMECWEYKKRGSIWNGILFIGGASSINKAYLQPGLNWFPEEDISITEMHRTFENIDSYGPENIHTVISHDAPAAFGMEEACTYGDGVEIIGSNRKFLQEVLDLVSPNYWFFGHYHSDLSGFYQNETYWRCIDQIRGPENQDHVYIELP